MTGCSRGCAFCFTFRCPRNNERVCLAMCEHRRGRVADDAGALGVGLGTYGWGCKTCKLYKEKKRSAESGQANLI